MAAIRPATPGAAGDTPAIEARDLTKRYGDRAGCLEICLSVPCGQVFGFLGPNGAGKSTVVKTLVGLLHPTSGMARLFGRPPGDPEARRPIGYLPELFRFQEWATAAEVLGFHASLSRLPAETARRRITEVLGMVGLAGHGTRRVRTFSKGMQQRLGLAVALVADPDLVFLDEPTSALDPLGRREVRELIQGLKAQGKTVFLNSHLLSEVEAVCDRVAVIKGGRVIAEGRLEELLAPALEIELRLGMDPAAREAILAALAGGGHPPILTEEAGDGTALVRLTAGSRDDIPRVVEAVVRAGGRVYEARPTHRSLEDLFMELMERGDG